MTLKTQKTIENTLVPQTLNSFKVRPEHRVYLGVSGGCDSIALFWTWIEIRRQKDIPFSVIHIEHGLRGEESKEDARFVENLCENNQVPFYLIQANVYQEMKEKKLGGLEEAARTLRYKGFKKIMAKDSQPLLYLAHHQEDQAETVLMNLLRGSGQRGLRGILKVRVWGQAALVRPFLGLSKAVLKQGLIEKGYAWREDRTNQENIGLRNTLRNDVLPALYRLYPQMGNALVRTSEILAEEESFWEEQIEIWLTKHGLFSNEICFIDQKALKKEASVFKRRILRACYEKALNAYKTNSASGMNTLNFEQTDNLVDFIYQGSVKKLSLPKNLYVEKGQHRIYFLKEETSAPLFDVMILKSPFSYKNIFLGSWCFSFTTIGDLEQMTLGSYGDDWCFQILNLKGYQQLQLRPRREGDFIYPKGSTGKKSLKKFMIDRKIDRPLRNLMVLLADGDEILWVPGYGLSQKVLVTDEVNHGILIKYTYSYQ